MPFVRLLLVPPLLLVASSGNLGAQASPCLPADSGAAQLVQYVHYLITSTDPAVVTLRGSLGLSNVSVSQVSVVTSETECARAQQAVDRLASTPGSGRRMYVVKAGNERFFVRDPNATAGEHTPALAFDNKWVFIKSLLGG